MSTAMLRPIHLLGRASAMPAAMPLASSSRSHYLRSAYSPRLPLQEAPYSRPFLPSRITLSQRRAAHAIPQPASEAGFEGVPPPARVEPVTDAKGKEKAVAEMPKRRTIKAKKSAITMTPAALDRLRDLLASPTDPKLLRIGVKSRGCAGMAYHLEYVPPPGGKFDEVVEQDGVKVLIDSKALFSIIGSKMDWRDNRLSAGFVFDNPNVVDTCGCGESFNIH